MKRKTIIQLICRLVAVFSFIAFIGIIGGIDNGEPLTNIIYFLPCIAVGIIAMYVDILGD